MEGWEEGRGRREEGGGRAGALVPPEGEGQGGQLRMGGVPSPKQAAPVRPWLWLKPRLKQVPSRPGAMLSPLKDSTAVWILILGDTGVQQFLLPQGPPLLNPELTLSPIVTQLAEPWPWVEWDGQHYPRSPCPIQKSPPQTSPSGLQGYNLQLVVDPESYTRSPCSRSDSPRQCLP